MLLAMAERRFGVAERLARCFPECREKRQPCATRMAISNCRYSTPISPLPLPATQAD